MAHGGMPAATLAGPPDEVAAGAKRPIRHIKPQALTAAQPADAA
jgi:hypothetical protein